MSDELRREVLATTLAEVVPEVGGLRRWREEVDVEGGVIFNCGHAEIADRDSELRQRWGIGVHSDPPYHSIDTGEYCMGPLFALEVAERIRPGTS